jgi:hypothetical protein
MTSQQLFQVWIVAYENWQPAAWNDVPPRAVALEPAEPALLTAVEAAQFVAGFNQTMIEEPRNLWAVPVPVVLRQECRLVPGLSVTAGQFDPWPLDLLSRDATAQQSDS